MFHREHLVLLFWGYLVPEITSGAHKCRTESVSQPNSPSPPPSGIWTKRFFVVFVQYYFRPVPHRHPPRCPRVIAVAYIIIFNDSPDDDNDDVQLCLTTASKASCGVASAWKFAVVIKLWAFEVEGCSWFGVFKRSEK